MEKPAIKKVTQISMVVDDLMAYVKRYNDDYGIGPWVLLDFNHENMAQLRIDNIPAEFGIRLGICDALNIQMELIQPLYGETTYMKFLRDHGPGLHHLCVDPEGGYKAFVDGLKEKGKDHFIVGGTEHGATGTRNFEYVDLRDEIGTIVELLNDDNFTPGPPAGFYPPQE